MLFNSPSPEGEGGAKHREGVSDFSMRNPKQSLAHAKRMRSQMTPAEDKLWQELRAKRLSGYKFRRQVIMGSYIVDFVCEQAKLIIEVDGVHHDDNIEYDNERTQFLKSMGYQVIRYKNGSVLADLNEVLDDIFHHLDNATNI